MKKVLARLSSVLAAIALCVCFSACSAGASTGITGTWKFYKSSRMAHGVEIQYEIGRVVDGVLITEEFIVLTVNEDKTFGLKSVPLMGERPYNGEWTEEDGKYYLGVEGADVEMILNGSSLSFEIAGMKVQLKKQVG